MQPKIITKENGSYAIEGELNNQTVPEIAQQLQVLMAQIEGSTFNLDLALVSRSDSAGVALLVDAMQSAKEADLLLKFNNLPQQMQDIAGLSGLMDILPISQH
ncbi:MAG: STAS domain-containing protein [Woeseiaceae bacterium]